MELSEETREGIQIACGYGFDQATRLLDGAIDSLINMNNECIINDIHFKKAHDALCILLLEALSQDRFIEKSSLAEVLMDDKMLDLDEQFFDEFISVVWNRLRTFGADILTSSFRSSDSFKELVGVEWQLNYTIRSSTEARNPFFLVQFIYKHENGQLHPGKVINYSHEQLVELVSKLADAKNQSNSLVHF